MFEPEGVLVRSYQIVLPSGARIVYDQSMWGKVIEIREIHLDGGRYDLDDYWATARLRQLLESATMEGHWVCEWEDPFYQEMEKEVRDVIGRLYGEANEW